MKNRLYVKLSLAVLTFAFVGAASFAQQGPTRGAKMERMEDRMAMQSCAKACSECQRACDTCATHCISMLLTGGKEHVATLSTCQDCATTCSAAAQIVARRGPFSHAICKACVEACEACAKECGKFPDDKDMASCAEQCHRCQEACQDMLKHVDSAK